MPRRDIATEGVILNKEDSGEDYLRYQVLTPEHGVLPCLQRRPGRLKAKTRPDLFDLARIALEQSRQSGSWFIREYRLLHRPAGLAASYEAVLHASGFAQILSKNLAGAGPCEPVYTLCLKALQNWEKGARPEAVFLKSLYLFAKIEGYPVKEQWRPSLKPAEQDAAAHILHHPLAGQTETPESVIRLTDSLKNWLAGHTDILI